MVTLSSAYLPPAAYLAYIVKSGGALIEACDHYTKQTLRNRALIAAPNGTQVLTVPTVKAEGKQLMRDVRISTHGNWQHLHWQALRTAYNASPYFEYYADDFAPFYDRPYTFLLDYNMELLRLILRLLDVDATLRLTTDYDPAPELDRRPFDSLTLPVRPYYQVFAHSQGFRPGLSSVDLLFNMGPEGILNILPQ